MAKHRTYSTEFKRQVAQEYIAGETLHGRNHPMKAAVTAGEVHAAWPQHLLNFLPEPQGHGALRPTLVAERRGSDCGPVL